MRKKILIIGCIVFTVLAVFIIGGTNGLSEGARVSLNGVNLTNIADGSYTGIHEFKRWSNTVVVHVKDGQIIGIDIEQDVSVQISSPADEILRRVIDAQDTTVDAVAGATVTSKAYLKAIENALNP